jgi:hypothetical protein
MKKINFELVDLPHEEITMVRNARIELRENTLFHFVEYSSKELEEHPEDPLISTWSENENYNYRECIVEKSKISVVELRITTPLDGEQHWCLGISGESFHIQTFFEIDNIKKAKEIRDEILEWLNWK